MERPDMGLREGSWDFWIFCERDMIPRITFNPLWSFTWLWEASFSPNFQVISPSRDVTRLS